LEIGLLIGRQAERDGVPFGLVGNVERARKAVLAREDEGEVPIVMARIVAVMDPMQRRAHEMALQRTRE
jgi:hypothetical protein